MCKGVRDKKERKKTKKEEKTQKKVGDIQFAKSTEDSRDAALEEKKDLAAQAAARDALQQAMSYALKKKSKTIASSLVQSSIGGQTRTVTTVLSLTEEEKESADRKRHGPSLAELLEAEPEWDDSMDNCRHNVAIE
jgi:hypothetical protein